MSKKSAPTTADQVNNPTSDEEVVDESTDIAPDDEAVNESDMNTKSSEEKSAAVKEEQESSETTDAGDSEESEGEMIERLQNKIAEQDDKYLRLQAEFENFKRRNSQEIKSKFKFAGQPLALSFLPGLDNLERALDQSRTEESEQLKEFITGIEMVQQQFYDALKQHNIERIYPIKEPFDPNKHEAMGVIETEEVEPDHIAQVFQAGYTYHDRVIRPAVVQVAKKK